MKRRTEQRAADKAPTSDASDTDTEAFARAMSDVTPLAPDQRGRVRANPSTGPRTMVRPASPAAAEDADDLQSGFVAPGVDRRELRKLTRGEHVPGHRLDLHGLTAADAIECVTRFIDQARPRHRCVCVVHGRGLHSEGQVAILKTRVRECLRKHRGVLAYADAPRTDGGPGAVYVLLRK